MKAIMFTLHLEITPEQQEAILSHVRSWESVTQVATLDPETEEPDIRHICYAYLGEDADPEAIVQRLMSLPEVASASVPPERRSIQGDRIVFHGYDAYPC